MNNKLKWMNLIYLLLAICITINSIIKPQKGFFTICTIVCGTLSIIAYIVYFVICYKDKRKEKE